MITSRCGIILQERIGNAVDHAQNWSTWIGSGSKNPATGRWIEPHLVFTTDLAERCHDLHVATSTRWIDDDGLPRVGVADQELAITGYGKSRGRIVVKAQSGKIEHSQHRACLWIDFGDPA